MKATHTICSIKPFILHLTLILLFLSAATATFLATSADALPDRAITLTHIQGDPFPPGEPIK
ncbi:hypothetical protein EI42_05283 [Thermosporothrix hazakensis]|jgi:hypothetical protein|uniref:Uncharacterized protein n=1 Tax=Thermosporothrix hazakensis TaxID=644383 RepID=A0A326U095_THEHA|nr:hypothetical protein EI42_05283 [Thermosporothrix hazakensis]